MTAGPVERVALLCRLVVQLEQAADDAGDGEHQVDVEAPAPRGVLGQHAAEQTLTRLIGRAHAEGSLRPDVTPEDLPLLLMMMVSEVAHHSHLVRPDIYRRYLQLLVDGLRCSPGNGDLARPLTDADVEALTRQWLPGPRRTGRA